MLFRGLTPGGGRLVSKPPAPGYSLSALHINPDGYTPGAERHIDRSSPYRIRLESSSAWMVKLVDTLVSGTSERELVEVRVLFQAKSALLSMGFSQSLKECPSLLPSRRWKRTRSSEEGGPTDQGGRIARMAIQPSQAVPEGGARTATTGGFRVLFQAKERPKLCGFFPVSQGVLITLKVAPLIRLRLLPAW